MNGPLFSVVTVVRNGAFDIARTVDSVRGQTFTDVEHLIIDGASTDGTLDVIARINSPLVRTYSATDAGIYDAMNKGLDLSTGAFVLFLNAGDVLASDDVLKKVSQGINDVACLYYGYVKIIGGAYSWYTRPGETGDSLSLASLPHHQSVFYPRHLIDRLRFDLSYKVQSDVDFTIRAIKNSKPVRLDICIAVSTLGGYSVQILSSLSATLRLAAEMLTIQMKYRAAVRQRSRVVVYGLHLVKWAVYTIGGPRMLYRLMAIRSRLGTQGSLR